MNDVAAWDTLELWAAAELRQGRAERAVRLFSLAERGYEQASAHPARTETETHRRLEADLRATLQDRYEPLLEQARTLEFDAAMEALGTETAGR
jgi:hypothetical protein